MTGPATVATRRRRSRRRSSKSVEHYTPPRVVAAGRTVLGAIDLDPASCHLANTVVAAGHFFAEADDGLSQPWAGRVFVNPPGGRIGNRYQAGLFFGKALAEWSDHRADAVIFVAFTLEMLRLSQAGSTCRPL